MTRRNRPRSRLNQTPTGVDTGVFARPVREPEPEPAPEPESTLEVAAPPAFPVWSGGIQGPVARAPVPRPMAEPLDRVRSTRVFAVVAGLIAMLCLSTLGAAGLTIAAVALVPPEAEIVDEPVSYARIEPLEVEEPEAYGVVEPEVVQVPAPKTPIATEEPEPEPVVDASSGAISVSIPTDQPFTGIEITCPISGYRQRASFTAGTASLGDVPVEDCNVIFKGGPPARNTIRGGQSKACSFQGGMAVCS